MPSIRPRSSVPGLLEALRSLAVVVPLLAPSAIRALEFDPAEPTTCDPVTVLVTRSFKEDCGWRAAVITDITPGPEGRIDLTLTPLKGGVICLPAVRDITFHVDLHTLPAGNYDVTARWTDLDGVPPEQASFKVAEAECPELRRADANSDGRQDLSDAVAILGHLFLGGSVACLDASDTDGSGRIEITDAVFLLNHLFLGGPAPPPPFPDCGPLPEGASRLGCKTTACAPGGGEPIWMEKPDGCVQCQPCAAPSLDEVVQALEDAGIHVLDSRIGGAAVCLACDVCPSGRFYVVLVSADDALALAAMGWTGAAGP